MERAKKGGAEAGGGEGDATHRRLHAVGADKERPPLARAVLEAHLGPVTAAAAAAVEHGDKVLAVVDLEVQAQRGDERVLAEARDPALVARRVGWARQPDAVDAPGRMCASRSFDELLSWVGRKAPFSDSFHQTGKEWTETENKPENRAAVWICKG